MFDSLEQIKISTNSAGNCVLYLTVAKNFIYNRFLDGFRIEVVFPFQGELRLRLLVTKWMDNRIDVTCVTLDLRIDRAKFGFVLWKLWGGGGLISGRAKNPSSTLHANFSPDTLD